VRPLSFLEKNTVIKIFKLVMSLFAAVPDDIGGFESSQDRREAMIEQLHTEPVVEEVEEVEEGAEEDVNGQSDEEKPDELGDESTDDELEPEEEEVEDEEAEDAEEEEQQEGEFTPEQIETLENNSAAIEGLAEALDGTDYPVDFTDLNKGMGEVGLRLADAHHLYDIVAGKENAVEGLFTRIIKFQGQAVHDNALTSVLKYAQKLGILDGPEEPKPGDLKDHVAIENARLRKEAETRNATETMNAERTRRATIFNSAAGKLKEIASEREISEEDINDFLLPRMAKAVGGNKAIINRIARGNFVDIAKIADEAINRLVGRRVETNNKRVDGRKVRDKKVPKRVAGGENERTVAASAKHDLTTSEGRRAAAKASLRSK
jgi:hypothetical protein